MSKVKKLSYRVFRVLMVLMLLLGFSLVPASAGPPWPWPPKLQVNVHAPEEVYVCQDFYVNATITNAWGQKISDVNACIEIQGPASVVDGGTPTFVGDIDDNAVKEVYWKLHCDGPEAVSITVTANGHVFTVPVMGDDTAKVKQIPRPDPVLVVEIIQSPDYPVNPCENFAIKAKIHNVTNEPMSGVFASIFWTKGDVEFAGPDQFGPFDMRAGASQEVGFTLHCLGPEDVEVVVDADFPGEVPGQVVPAGVTVVQVGTVLKVELSTDSDKLCPECDEFNTATVTAKVTNIGDETAEGVEVTLAETWGGDATITPPLTQGLPDIPVDGSATATWTVTCTGHGDAGFEATADADNAASVLSNEIEIEQRDFIVQILTPEDGATFSYCQNYPLTMRVINCKEVGIDTRVTLSMLPPNTELAPGSVVHVEPSWGPAYDVDPAERTLRVGVICPCCYVDVTWMLHCRGSGVGDITVTANEILGAPPDGAYDEDTVSIKQEWKAHLTAGIEVFPGWASDGTMNCMPIEAAYVCQNFTVVIAVTNLGEADANDVCVVKNVVGPTSCAGLHTYGGLTIKGGESIKIIEECHCDGEGAVSIWIEEISGTDENTGEPIPADNIELPCPRNLDQIPIEVEFLEPLEGQEFTECDYFAVKVKLHNSSETQDLRGLHVMLDWDGNAELIGEPFLEAFDLLRGGTHELVWQMHCTHKGAVTFFLKVISEEPVMKIERWVSVMQNPPPPEWKRADVELCQLWNLISLPLIPEDPDIETVLSRTGAEVKKVAYYTGGPAGTWQFYSPSAPSDLTQMVDGKGYWMDIGATGDGNLRVWGYEHCGPPPAVPPYYEVVEGWNMIGFQSMVSKPASDYLAAIAGDLMVIYGFNCGTQTYYIVPPTGNLDPGNGYLIALTGPGTIYP